MTPPFVFEEPGTGPASIGAENIVDQLCRGSCHLAASMPRLLINQIDTTDPWFWRAL